MLAGLLGVLDGDGLRGLLELVRGRRVGGGEGQGGPLVQQGVSHNLDRRGHRLECGGEGAVLVQQVRPGLLQLHLGGGHGGEGARLLQQAQPLLAQLGREEGGLERGREGLQLVHLALRVGGAHFGGGEGVLDRRGRKRHHLLHFLQQYGQLHQLLLWQAHVWRGDGGRQVLDDGGEVEGDEEAVGTGVVEGLVEGEDLIVSLIGLFQRGILN